MAGAFFVEKQRDLSLIFVKKRVFFCVFEGIFCVLFPNLRLLTSEL